jgi:hypothetical protein
MPILVGVIPWGVTMVASGLMGQFDAGRVLYAREVARTSCTIAGSFCGWNGSVRHRFRAGLLVQPVGVRGRRASSRREFLEARHE